MKSTERLADLEAEVRRLREEVERLKAAPRTQEWHFHTHPPVPVAPVPYVPDWTYRPWPWSPTFTSNGPEPTLITRLVAGFSTAESVQ